MRSPPRGPSAPRITIRWRSVSEFADRARSPRASPAPGIGADRVELTCRVPLQQRVRPRRIGVVDGNVAWTAASDVLGQASAAGALEGGDHLANRGAVPQPEVQCDG